MKTQLTVLKPTATAFFGTITLSIIIMFGSRAIIDIIKSPKTIELNIDNWWILMTFLAIGPAMFATFGERKQRLLIVDMNDSGKVHNRIVEFLSDSGSKVVKKKEYETDLKPVSRFNQLFNNWFGMESISVKLVSKKIVVIGPRRRIDGLKKTILSELTTGINTF
jgi:hypothetical protein